MKGQEIYDEREKASRPSFFDSLGSNSQETLPRLDRFPKHKEEKIKCFKMGLPPLLSDSGKIPPLPPYQKKNSFMEFLIRNGHYLDTG